MMRKNGIAQNLSYAVFLYGIMKQLQDGFNISLVRKIV